MIEVDTNSWHYRFMRWMYKRPNEEYFPPSDLCTYFWSLIATFLGAVLVAIVIVPASPAIGIGFGGKWAWEHRPQRSRKQPPRKRPPSMTMAFLKAKKQKLCPLIEYSSQKDHVTSVADEW